MTTAAERRPQGPRVIADEGPSGEHRLLDTFEAYLRRVLPDAGPEGIWVGSDRSWGSPDPTVVGVVTGRGSPRAARRRRRATALTRQFAGGLGTGAGRPGGGTVEIYDRWDRARVPPRPPSFDVLAIITVFNEADIISSTLDRLLEQGIRVQVIDNWSTDGTFDIVSSFAASGSVGVERFPEDGPQEYFEFQRSLRRKEELAHASGADWVIHTDADEIRESPWPGVSLIDGLWAVDHWDFNVVDHTVLNFRPVDDRWRGGDPRSQFGWFEFGDRSGSFQQLKTWKRQSGPAELARFVGHTAHFEGHRVFPYKFVTRHYPIRSQAHGERKLFDERFPRWAPDARARGQHTHYDQFSPGDSFIWDRSRLHRWADLDRRFLLPRLSGVGLAGNPRPEEGAPVGDGSPETVSSD